MNILYSLLNILSYSKNIDYLDEIKRNKIHNHIKMHPRFLLLR